MSELRPLEKCSALEKKYLSRLQCAWCDHGLDRPGCGAIYGPCTKEVQDERRARALKDYKPRLRLVSAMEGRP